MAMNYRDRPLYPPEVEVDWFGFSASGPMLQRAGWQFEEINDGISLDNIFGERRRVTMRHPSGLSGIAECNDRDLRWAVNERLGLSSAPAKIVFQVIKMASRSTELHVFTNIARERWKSTALDFDPGFVEFEMRHRFTLADLYPERPPEEIIVDPVTVSSLLDQIKKLQAPELADIRERNRRAEARERLTETRHATILTLS